MIFPDHYSTLGVAPDAEDIVITAAYRALAQRYHPDKSAGSESSHVKMAALNEAYGVLSNAARRAEYDRSYRRSSEQSFEAQDDEEQSTAFSEAMKEVDGRWQVAKSVYADIEALRERLARFSTQLAFAYVTTLLERKDFERRRDIAAQLESSFLRKYFGSNEQIITYARDLILGGSRDAAKALNRLVDVLGAPANAQLYIEKIERDFKLRETREARAGKDKAFQRLLHLNRVVWEFGYYDEAKELAKLKGYEIEEFGGGIFTSTRVRAKTSTGKENIFDNVPQFVSWVQSTLCTLT
jgi:curved DNA-binding protein CbpA